MRDYRTSRSQEYPPLEEQFDLLFHDIVANKVDATGEFVKALKATKEKFPKP